MSSRSLTFLPVSTSCDWHESARCSFIKEDSKLTNSVACADCHPVLISEIEQVHFNFVIELREHKGDFS